MAYCINLRLHRCCRYFFSVIIGFTLLQCSFIFDQLQPDPIIATCPLERNSILSAGDTIAVEFASGIDRSSAEAVFSLRSLTGQVPGTFHWQGNRLEFFPATALKKGGRYSLELCGSVQMSPGPRRTLQTVIPFFYLHPPGSSDSEVMYQPQSGSELEAQTPIQLHFPAAVDTAAVTQDLQLSPMSLYSLEWNRSSTTLSLIPEKRWSKNTIYSLEFSSLPYASAYYVCNFESPDSIELYISPVEMNWEEDLPETDSELTELPPEESIQLSLNYPVDQDEFESAFSLEPFCRGSFYWKDTLRAVFIPDDNLSRGTTYHCSIKPFSSQSILHSINFTSPQQFHTTALPSVRRVSGEGVDGFSVDPDQPADTAVDITPDGDEGNYSFLLEYSQAVPDEKTRRLLQEQTAVSAIFPPDIPAPAIVSFMWPDALRMLVQIQGFGVQSDHRECYYSLAFAGSLSGDSTAGGTLKVRVRP
ncbi:MAG: Ig-like domain-containing protein [Spirochaetaceae bacterium]|nr:Ig-like domain-containing protein [Spirochaetaceae bacterium]MCF7950752.1 Ig-like domain-containing protein [Spirochaetaceae bacterium]